MRRNKDLYQIPESLTPAADSRISVDVIQHGKQLLEGLPCLLRFHFALTLTRLNCTSWREDRAIPIRPDVFWRLRKPMFRSSRLRVCFEIETRNRARRRTPLNLIKSRQFAARGFGEGDRSRDCELTLAP